MASTTKTTAPRQTHANKLALRKALAELNDGSADAYLALFAPDARLHGFPPGIHDVGSLTEFHAATTGLYPDASVTLHDAVAERDRVATRYTWRASSGPGQDLVAQGGAIMRFAGGRITECWNLPAELATVAADN